jgi:hypothetical protein
MFLDTRSKVDFGIVFATALTYIIFSFAFKFVQFPVNVLGMLIGSAIALLILGKTGVASAELRQF